MLVTEVGVVPTGVDDDVPAGESGALGSVDEVSDVPSGLDVDVGVNGTGVAVGSLGSTRLSGFPGPYRVLRWSGSSRWVSGSGAALAPARA